MDYFRLHGNCFIVKGASKALVCDLFKSRTVGISLRLAELYETEFLSLSYQGVLRKYAEFRDQIIDLVDNLIENDFGFLTEEPECFPKLDTSYLIKKRIYSAVIELDGGLLDQYKRLFNNLILLDCSVFYLVIREKLRDLDKFEELLKTFKESRATCVQIVFDKPYFSFDQLNEVTHDMRINYKIYGAHADEIVKGRWWLEESIYKFKLVEYKTEPFDLNKKSQYGEDFFSPTQAVFVESKDHNPFFNLKVCISKNGEYKNDLSFEESFGDFRSRSLDDLLTDKGFKRLWYLPNDEIEKCKDCQFRYQCVSNSNIRREDTRYYKINSCSFNPYNSTWGGVGKQILL